MGNICGSKEPSYGKRINDIYKDAIEHGETSKNLLSTLTLRAVTYPDQLPSIGSTLELKIKGDFSKNNEFNVSVGCDILDGLIQTRSDLSYFVVNLDGVIELLIEKGKPKLKRRAINLLTIAVDFASGASLRTFNKYEAKLIEISKGEDLELKVYSLNAIAKMVPKLESFSVTPVIPTLLSTIYKYLESQSKYDDLLVFRIPNVDFSKLTNESATKIAVECLSAITRQANDGSIRHVLKPIWDFLDEEHRWFKKPEFVKTILRIVVSCSMEWASKGYVIVSNNMQHFEEILDRSDKAGMILANIFIISIQSKKGATSGTRSSEAVTQLVSTLKYNFPTDLQTLTPQQYEDILKNDILISSVFECLSVIAQRGKFTQQNVSLLDSIQQLVRLQHEKEQVLPTSSSQEFSSTLSQTTVQHLLLVECLLCVARVGSYVLSNQQQAQQNGSSASEGSSVKNQGGSAVGGSGAGSSNTGAAAGSTETYYPSHIINALLESSVRSSNVVYVRSKYLDVILSLLNTKEVVQKTVEPIPTSSEANNGESSNFANAITQKKSGLSPAVIDDVDNTSTAIKTRITISKSQRAKIYMYLYKGLFLNDNLPQNYACIARILRNLLKQYRNKEIENALPMLFKLQEDASTTPTTATNGSSSTSSSDAQNGYEAGEETPQQTASERSQVTMSIRNKLMIHTLIVIYLLCLGELYNSRELEQYIKSIMDSRIQKGFMTRSVLTTFEKRHNSGNSLETMKPSAMTEEEKLREYTKSFTSLLELVDSAAANIDKIELVSQEKVCELLCKVETLKETYGDVAGVTKVVKKPFTGDSITKTTAVVVDIEENSKRPTDDPWYSQTTEDMSGADVQVIEGIDIDQLNVRVKNVSRDSLRISQIQLDPNNTNASNMLTKKREEKSQRLESILNNIPSSPYDSDDEDAEEQKPKLYLFDSPQFISI